MKSDKEIEDYFKKAKRVRYIRTNIIGEITPDMKLKKKNSYGNVIWHFIKDGTHLIDEDKFPKSCLGEFHKSRLREFPKSRLVVDSEGNFAEIIESKSDEEILEEEIQQAQQHVLELIKKRKKFEKHKKLNSLKHDKEVLDKKSYQLGKEIKDLENQIG